MRFKWPMLFSVTTIGLFFDWYTKFLAEKYLEFGVAHPVIGNVLEFFLIYNKGAVFGLNPKALHPAFPTNTFFFIFNGIAITLLFAYFAKAPKNDRFIHWGLAFILPGAFGNLLDRILHPAKGVVDFIKVDLGFPPFNPWPIFNLADIYVSVGVALLIISFILEGKGKKQENNNTNSTENTSQQNNVPQQDQP